MVLRGSLSPSKAVFVIVVVVLFKWNIPLVVVFHRLTLKPDANELDWISSAGRISCRILRVW